MLRVLNYTFDRRVKWSTVEVERYVDETDGHTYSVYWATPLPTNRLDEKIYVLIAGMLSSHDSKYLGRFVEGLSSRGATCVLNYPLIVDKATGETIPDYSDDRYLRAYLEMLQLRYPRAQLVVVGFSIGGSIAIKCADIADAVVAVCSPVKGSDAWDSIKHVYFEMMRAAFLTGPMTRLLVKEPTRWVKAATTVLFARNSKHLTTQLEAETGHLIYHMTIEKVLEVAPLEKITMIHTRDDRVIPYLQDSDPIFARVKRVTLEKGDHILFNAEEAAQVLALIP